MQLVNILSENEINLLNKAQIDYSQEDANKILDFLAFYDIITKS